MNEAELVGKSCMRLNSQLPGIHLALKGIYLGSRRLDMSLESLYEDFEFIDYCRGAKGWDICSKETFKWLKTFHNAYANFRRDNLFSDDSIIYLDKEFTSLTEFYLKPLIISLEIDFLRFGHKDFISVLDQEKRPLLTFDELLDGYKKLFEWAANHDILITKCWTEVIE